MLTRAATDRELSQAWSPQLVEEITDLLAEALFLDFQQHIRATVKSPRGNDHRNVLTGTLNENK